MKSYEDFVPEGRSNLELLLRDRPTHENISDAWLVMWGNLHQNGVYFHKLTLGIGFKYNYVSVVFSYDEEKQKWLSLRKGQGWTLEFTTGDQNLSSRIVAQTETSGILEMYFYHELGELIFLYPLLGYIGQMRSDRISQLETEKNPEMQIVSKETPSDLWADLLTSTFCPLSPEQQLNLLENEIPENFKGYGLDVKQADYAYIQLARIKSITKLKDYAYAEEVNQLYLNILKIQKGLDPEQRKDFLLGMYDITQDHFQKGMTDVGEAIIVKLKPGDIIEDLTDLANDLDGSVLRV